MSRYFFHVRMKAGSILRDRVGIEFHDLAAARTDAEEAVRQTIIEKKAAGQPIEMDSLQITDRAGPHPGRRRFRCRSRAGYIHAYEAIGDGSALSLWH